jgi:hypothetical protein
MHQQRRWIPLHETRSKWRWGVEVYLAQASGLRNPQIYSYFILNKKFWEELIAYFPSKRRKQHRNWCVQKFFYCCLCIRCHGNVFSKPLPSNDMRIRIQTHRLMRGIYGVLLWDGLRCHELHTKFHKDWFSHSDIDKGDRQYGDLISLLFLIRK